MFENKSLVKMTFSLFFSKVLFGACQLWSLYMLYRKKSSICILQIFSFCRQLKINNTQANTTFLVNYYFKMTMNLKCEITSTTFNGKKYI